VSTVGKCPAAHRRQPERQPAPFPARPLRTESSVMIGRTVTPGSLLCALAATVARACAEITSDADALPWLVE
jgi:hypothetical protein